MSPPVPSAAGAPVLVVGVGNPHRGDDAAGLLVARRVRDLLRAQPIGPEADPISVTEQGGEATALLAAWEGAQAVVVVDAAAGATSPGTVHRIDAREGRLAAVGLRCSTHTLGVTEAVSLARALGRLPPHLVVYAVEGRSFEAGAPLSPEVEAAIPLAAARVLAEARQVSG